MYPFKLIRLNFEHRFRNSPRELWVHFIFHLFSFFDCKNRLVPIWKFIELAEDKSMGSLSKEFLAEVYGWHVSHYQAVIVVISAPGIVVCILWWVCGKQINRIC